MRGAALHHPDDTRRFNDPAITTSWQWIFTVRQRLRSGFGEGSTVNNGGELKFIVICAARRFSVSRQVSDLLQPTTVHQGFGQVSPGLSGNSIDWKSRQSGRSDSAEKGGRIHHGLGQCLTIWSGGFTILYSVMTLRRK